jgi:hypothetical protein
MCMSNLICIRPISSIVKLSRSSHSFRERVTYRVWRIERIYSIVRIIWSRLFSKESNSSRNSSTTNCEMGSMGSMGSSIILNSTKGVAKDQMKQYTIGLESLVVYVFDEVSVRILESILYKINFNFL